jgi:hypothetical protein
MTLTTKPIPNPPASLVKRGILGVSDNLLPGESLAIGRAFMQVFRPELEAHFLGSKPSSQLTGGTKR